MAKRRTSEVELCFDSMTDLITNLAGGLILLVLLLLGVTREAPSQTVSPRPDQAGKPTAGDKPITPLRHQVEALRLDIANVDKDINRLEKKLPTLRKQVQELIDKTEKVEPPKEQENEKEKKEVKTVEYRPPLLGESDKNTNVSFVCRENRLYLFDMDAFGDAFRLAVRAKDPTKGDMIRLSSGDFDVRIDHFAWVQRGGRNVPDWSAVLLFKAGSVGETLETVKTPQSAFQRRLKQLDPDKSTLQFWVYPDSFLAFWNARSSAWDGDFDLNWIPQEAGEPPRLGEGRARRQ